MAKVMVMCSEIFLYSADCLQLKFGMVEAKVLFFLKVNSTYSFEIRYHICLGLLGREKYLLEKLHLKKLKNLAHAWSLIIFKLVSIQSS